MQLGIAFLYLWTIATQYMYTFYIMSASIY